MIRRTLLTAALGIVLSACAAGPALFGSSTGQVTGHVRVRACGGANVNGEGGCHMSPVSVAEVTFRLSRSSTVSVAKTNDAGVYTIALAPGTYTAQLMAPQAAGLNAAMPNGPPGREFSGPRTITVVAGKTVTADFLYTIELV